MAKPETHAAIKAKFPKLNLTKKRLDLIGDKLEPKVTETATLDSLIDSFNELQPIEDLAKLDDQVATANKKLKEASNPPKKEETTEEPPITATEDMPAWAKALIDQNKKVTEALTGLQTEKIQGSIRQKATEALKDVPVSYWGKRAIPQKEDELDAFVSDVKSDYGTFTKEMTDKGLKVMSVPRSGSAAGSEGTGKVDPSVKAFADKQAAKEAPKTVTVVKQTL